MKDIIPAGSFRSSSVKGLSRHKSLQPNLRYEYFEDLDGCCGLFHGPLDSLAFLRVTAVPITGNWI
jgi:hypothetical protein